MIRNKMPLLSLCIPTYNRAGYLKECLDSIVSQFKDKKIFKQVEIIVSDNNSKDHTQELVKQYRRKYPNIRYYKNKKNIGSIKNVIRATSYTRGVYIWFFADDDLHYTHSLTTIIRVIENYHPDAIICNLDLSSLDGKKIIDKNLLRLTKDVIVKTKKELFSHLESKFFTPLDWYYTCMSNTIIGRKIYQENLKRVMKIDDQYSNNFPHSGFIYYNSMDYSIYFLYKTVGKYRTDNRSFGPNEKTRKADYLLFLYTILKRHNDLIYKYNKLSMSLKFKLLLFLKNASREIRRLVVKKTGYDISSLLLKLFPQ